MRATFLAFAALLGLASTVAPSTAPFHVAAEQNGVETNYRTASEATGVETRYRLSSEQNGVETNYRTASEATGVDNGRIA